MIQERTDVLAKVEDETRTVVALQRCKGVRVLAASVLYKCRPPSRVCVSREERGRQTPSLIRQRSLGPSGSLQSSSDREL